MPVSEPLDSQPSADFCVVCGKPARGVSGYCRLLHEDRMFALCCPLCLETFQKRPEYYVAIWVASQAFRPKGKTPNDG